MFGLPDTFFSKFQMMGFHMWLVCRRLRTEGAEGEDTQSKFRNLLLSQFECYNEKSYRINYVKLLMPFALICM